MRTPPSDRVHELVLGLEAAAHAAEDLQRPLGVLVGHARAARDHRHALADEARRVGHGADDLALGQPLRELLEANARGDADDQFARQDLAHLGRADRHADFVGLHAHDDDVRELARLEVVTARADAVLLAEGLDDLGAAIGRVHLGRLEAFRVQEPAHDGLAHRAAAEDGQRLVVGEHSP
jgi:hypothetical protein